MVATILIIFQNKLTNLASLVQFKCMLMFCLENWKIAHPFPLFSTPLGTRVQYNKSVQWISFVTARDN